MDEKTNQPQQSTNPIPQAYPQQPAYPYEQPYPPRQQAYPNQQPVVTCPQCGAANISFQMFQENAGTTTVSKTKSKYKQKGHGLLWWLFIGWWWWIIDLFLWIFLFPIRAIVALTKKKKYKGKSTTVQQTINQVAYKTMCLCGNCGYTWVKSDILSNRIKNAAPSNVRNLKRTVR